MDDFADPQFDEAALPAPTSALGAELVHRLVVGAEGSGERLDKYLATQLSQGIAQPHPALDRRRRGAA
jgi:hypothetical protein